MCAYFLAVSSGLFELGLPCPKLSSLTLLILRRHLEKRFEDLLTRTRHLACGPALLACIIVNVGCVLLQVHAAALAYDRIALVL